MFACTCNANANVPHAPLRLICPGIFCFIFYFTVPLPCGDNDDQMASSVGLGRMFSSAFLQNTTLLFTIRHYTNFLAFLNAHPLHQRTFILQAVHYCWSHGSLKPCYFCVSLSSLPSSALLLLVHLFSVQRVLCSHALCRDTIAMNVPLSFCIPMQPCLFRRFQFSYFHHCIPFCFPPGH